MIPVVLLATGGGSDEALIAQAIRRARAADVLFKTRNTFETLQLIRATGSGHEHELRAPDLVIIDMALPDGGAFDVIRRLDAVQATRGLPIVVLTASDAEEAALQEVLRRPARYVRKVHDLERYVGVMRALAHHWSLSQRRPLRATGSD